LFVLVFVFGLLFFVVLLPESIGVVQAASENDVMRIKNVPTLVGFVTLVKVTVDEEALGVEASPDFTSLRAPAVALFAVQPDASPSPVGWFNDEVFTKPAGVVHAPAAVVQALASNDWMIVAVVATLNVNV
jgi:hypothetical protein